MSNPNPKLVMMRFDPRGGWVKPSDEKVEVEGDDVGLRAKPAAVEAPAKFSAQSINEIGESIADVFNSLKLEDPRLQAWEQVNSAIRRMSDKLTEQKLLEDRLDDGLGSHDGERETGCCSRCSSRFTGFQ